MDKKEKKLTYFWLQEEHNVLHGLDQKQELLQRPELLEQQLPKQILHQLHADIFSREFELKQKQISQDHHWDFHKPVKLRHQNLALNDSSS